MGIRERKKREKEFRRQQIMSAARKVFASKGFKKATMEDIAREAEYSPGTLYLYFKNKDELNASLSINVLEYLVKQLQEVNEREDLDPLQKLQALRKALYEVYEFDSLLLLNIFHLQSGDGLTSLSGEMLEVIKRLSGNALREITKVYQEGIDAGCFIDRHPVALADITWSIFTGVVLWEDSKNKLSDDKDYLKQTFDVAFEILIRGVTKQAETQ